MCPALAVATGIVATGICMAGSIWAVRYDTARTYAHRHLLTSKATADSRRIGDYRWDHAGRAARELDEMTGLEWLDSALPDPGDRLLRLATAQYMSEEYGLDLDELSAIAMVSEFGPSGAASDERFHVHGGNDQIPHGIAARLPAGTVRLGHALSTLRRRDDRSYALSFEVATGDSSGWPRAGCTSGASTRPWPRKVSSRARCAAVSAVHARCSSR